MLKDLSNYDLLYELLQEGKGEVYPDLEPINTRQIIKILEERASKEFGNNINTILNWFMSSDDVATQEEKNNIKTILKIKNIEKKALEKIKGDVDTQ